MSRACKPVLIASSSFDEHTHGPVHRILRSWGIPVVVYLVDRVMAGVDRFSLDIDELGHVNITCDGQFIGPEAVGSAWYWKVTNFRVRDAEQNVAKQLTLVNEIAQTNSSIWGLYPDSAWLSPPSRIWAAERKLCQLLTAQSVGFNTPHTHMSSDWTDCVGAFKDDPRGMIVKMFRGVVADQNEIRAMYTTHLTDDLVAVLRKSTTPFPGIYQPFLPKAREWRVTVVGDDVFAAAIYTDDTAKDDWRRLQETAAVALRRERLPEDIADRCRAYLRECELGLGSFDLIESPDGRIVFLECNPNGQFGFLEEILGFPISAAIAGRLVAIARAE